MIGRQDLIYKKCYNCKGTGKDPKRRKYPCPTCFGYGLVDYCKTCGELMPCGGTDNDLCDQSLCLKHEP